jgi:hypothetical protein
MNGMDGVTIDREKVGSIARGSFGAAKAALQAWFVAEGALTAEVDARLDDIWAVLHGMATLSRSFCRIRSGARTALRSHSVDGHSRSHRPEIAL